MSPSSFALAVTAATTSDLRLNSTPIAGASQSTGSFLPADPIGQSEAEILTEALCSGATGVAIDVVAAAAPGAGTSGPMRATTNAAGARLAPVITTSPVTCAASPVIISTGPLLVDSTKIVP